MTTASRRVGLVTGANRGLGYALCRALAQQGKKVYLSGRDAAFVTQAAATLAAEGLPIRPVTFDVTSEASVNTAVDQIMAQHERIDVLIYNAGIVGDAGQKAPHPDFQRVEQIVDTNLMGAWRCVAAAAPYMIAAGYGRIVTISSRLAATTATRCQRGSQLPRRQKRPQHADPGTGCRTRRHRRTRQRRRAPTHPDPHGAPRHRDDHRRGSRHRHRMAGDASRRRAQRGPVDRSPREAVVAGTQRRVFGVVVTVVLVITQ
ncbi:hypothetical protein HDA40_005535 [Hamadaea flava]|uniref:SDR family NAD(P)-dependent oxidoreductase n=1 Tax=Hamadaea flava TaxID=1742688 RepID=UPI003FD85A8D|nr:hypothetical protein [Hamadaea flava]